MSNENTYNLPNPIVDSKELNTIDELTKRYDKLCGPSVVSKAGKKGWTEMASKGGTELFLVQMRALANKAAKNALEKAGQKGIEKSIFKDVFGQIGKKLTQKTITRSIPVVSGVIGALFDGAQMQKVLEYADIFYNKRFLLEKEKRIDMLTSKTEKIIDVEFYESECDIN